VSKYTFFVVTIALVAALFLAVTEICDQRSTANAGEVLELEFTKVGSHSGIFVWRARDMTNDQYIYITNAGGIAVTGKLK